LVRPSGAGLSSIGILVLSLGLFGQCSASVLVFSLVVFLVLQCAEEFRKVHYGPDKQRQIEGLGHGRGLHVDQVRICCIGEGGGPCADASHGFGAGIGLQDAAHQAKYSRHSENEGDHGRKRAARAALPQRVGPQERDHQQVRQGEPDGPQLQGAGSERIEDAPGNIDVGDGVSVEEKIAALIVVEEGKQRHEHGNSGHAGRAEVANGGGGYGHFTFTGRSVHRSAPAL
jgi:hypothetical protein